jgi:hypothetical protein
MANGAKEGTALVGDLHGTICNNKGKEISHVIMSDIAYLPTGKFNLFSCSKLQQEGWIMHGDKEVIKMTKEGAEIVFDIIIPTAKGAIYAMYFNRSDEVATAVTDDAVH